MAILTVDANTFALWLMDETTHLSNATERTGNAPLGLVRNATDNKVPRYDIDDAGAICRVGNNPQDLYLIGAEADGAMLSYFQDFVLKFRVRLDAAPAGGPDHIFGISAVGETLATNQMIAAVTTASKLELRWEYAGGSTPSPAMVSTAALTLGVWYDVEIRYTSTGSLAYYIDGVLDSTHSFPAPPAAEPPTHQAFEGGTSTKLYLFTDITSASATFHGAVNGIQVYNGATLVLDFPLDDAPDARDEANKLHLVALNLTEVIPTLALTTDPLGTAKSKTFGGSVDAVLAGPSGAIQLNADVATMLRGTFTFDTWVKIFPGSAGASHGLWAFGSATGADTTSNNFATEILFNSSANGYSMVYRWETGLGIANSYTSPVNTISYATMQTHRAIHLAVIKTVTGGNCVFTTYVNGVLVDTSPSLTNFDGLGSATGSRFALGVGITSSSEMVGSLDEVRFSPVARLASEFLAIYDEGANPITLSDTTAPVILGIIYPAAPDDFFEFDAYDASPGLRMAQVLVELANETIREAAYDEGAFRGRYLAGGSSVSGAGTSGSPYHFRVRPVGGWPVMPSGQLHRVIPHFVDQHGNELVIP